MRPRLLPGLGPTSAPAWVESPGGTSVTSHASRRTGFWSGQRGGARPWWPSAGPSWSSSGTCSPIPSARYTDLGSDFYATRINPERRRRNNIRQLEALGYKVILEPAAWPSAAIQPGSADAPPGAAARPL